MTHARPELLITESAIDRLKQAASLSHPLETGGILVGVHADQQPWATMAIELPTSSRGRAHYQLAGGTTQPAVLSTRAIDPRLGYIGDWHSHPADVPPSRTDLASLRLISYLHPRLPNPTLLVLRRRLDGDYDLDARRITTVNPARCAVRITGDLPTHVHDSMEPND
ncbi:Mov34/MPN/PAD-1 family protein [Kribbella sp. NPDC051936]|uniref:Mov34/MPN/PAD-1 family protein n=1 Tax=Kribbella sp. NPDC051936 TaxID=3154946 RepID=UPI00342A1518